MCHFLGKIIKEGRKFSMICFCASSECPKGKWNFKLEEALILKLLLHFIMLLTCPRKKNCDMDTVKQLGLGMCVCYRS